MNTGAGRTSMCGLAGVGLGVLLVLSGLVAWRSGRAPGPGVSDAGAPAEAVAEDGMPGWGSGWPGPRAASSFGQPGPAVTEEAARVVLRTELAELRAMYGQTGTLDWEERRVLIEQRKAQGEQLVRQLAHLGGAGARAIAAAYAEQQTTREKLLLVQALGANGDPAAVDVLQQLLAAEPVTRLREEMIQVLAARTGDERAAQALAESAQQETDPRLRKAALQGLTGQAEAVEVLLDRIRGDADSQVRRTALAALGRIETNQARQVLEELARGSGETDAAALRLRQQAIPELARAQGEAALPQLRQLLEDPTESIRLAVVLALGRFASDEVRTVLEQVAREDPAPAVRSAAAALLAGRREERGTRNEERGTRNEERGARNEERGTRNEERGMRNEE